MAHELAVALQQARRVRQRGAVKKSHVDVRTEDIDIAERRLSQTGYRAAVMKKLANFVAAASHHVKPVARDRSQFARAGFQPFVDDGIARDSTVESQYVGFHRD